MRFADTVVALLTCVANRIAHFSAVVLDVCLANSVVTLLAGGASRAARLTVLQLDFDLFELTHAGLVGAVIAILDLHVHEVVVGAVHLHPCICVIDSYGETRRLGEGQG